MATDYIDEIFDFDAPKYFDFTKLKPIIWTEADDILFKFKKSNDQSNNLESNNNINEFEILSTNIKKENGVSQGVIEEIDDLNEKFDLIELELDHWFSQCHPAHSPKKAASNRISISQQIPTPKDTLSEKRASIASKKKLSTLPSTNRKLSTIPSTNRKSSIVGGNTGGNTSTKINRVSITKAIPPKPLTTTSSTISNSKTTTTTISKPSIPSKTTSSNTIKQASKSTAPIKIPEFSSETNSTVKTNISTTTTSKLPPIQPAAKKLQNNSKPPLSSTRNVNSNQLPPKPTIKKIPIVKTNTVNTIISITRPISTVNTTTLINRKSLIPQTNIKLVMNSNNIENKENINEIDCKNNINIINNINNSNNGDNKKTCKLTTTSTELELDDSLKLILDQHNKKFMKPSSVLDSTLHSVKDVKMWEEYSGKKYQELSIEDRHLANQWISEKKKEQPKFISNMNTNRQSIF